MSVDQWTCGHVAGSMCAKCYADLAAKAAALQAEVDRYEMLATGEGPMRADLPLAVRAALALPLEEAFAFLAEAEALLEARIARWRALAGSGRPQ